MTPRWYMITNAQPWDNLKFDQDGVAEVKRKFFGTLHNVYSFFSLYANIDNFSYKEDVIAFEKRSELDQWVISELNSLIKKVDNYFKTKPKIPKRFRLLEKYEESDNAE